MKPWHFLPLLLLSLTATACNSSVTADTEKPTADISSDQTKQQAASTTKNLIPTQPLTPQPIRISLRDLPKPFATNSASKSANVIPIPQNPSLNVPAGFQVNVYADNLESPRWLRLTPNGEVLVTETKANRIRLIPDRNGDGVADVNRVFATADNGVNIPFGMTFSGNSFFLANTGEVRKYRYVKGQQKLASVGQKSPPSPQAAIINIGHATS